MRSRTLRWLALTLLGALVVVVLAMTDSATAASHRDLRTLAFGRPWNWLTQDQSTLDPPFPVTLHLGLPQEHPSYLVLAPLLADLALAVGASWLIWALLERVIKTLFDRTLRQRGRRGSQRAHRFLMDSSRTGPSQ